MAYSYPAQHEHAAQSQMRKLSPCSDLQAVLLEDLSLQAHHPGEEEVVVEDLPSWEAAEEVVEEALCPTASRRYSTVPNFSPSAESCLKSDQPIIRVMVSCCCLMNLLLYGSQVAG